ncbi:MAG: NAD(P)/FAD-dependent oxidoreductase [Thiogranum sp.]
MDNATHVDSWYAASAARSTDYPDLRGDTRVDVCVLGAGITGLSTAIHLAEQGYRVAVLEARRVGWGASGRSGGQMIFGFASDQSKLVRLVGSQDAKKIWACGLEGIDLLRELVARFHIDCDLVHGHVHAAIKPRQAEELRAWQADLENTYGYRSLKFLDRQQIRAAVANERYVAGLHDSNSGHIHPLNYVLGLAAAAESLGVRIYETSAVVDISEGAAVSAKTAHGRVTADFLVLAGNAYLARLAPGIETKIMPVGTYIGASEPLGEERCRALIGDNAAVADINFVLDYFRCSADHRMLFGGRVSYSTLPPPNLKATMQKRMAAVFPQLQDVRMEYAWGGFVAITMNRAPHFGRIGSNIYFAHGFSGHGIAATGLAGKLMADAIHGTAEKFDVFSRIPHHDFPGGRALRTPALVLAMTWYRLRDLLP